MKIYTCTDHDSVWVGGASVIIAKSRKGAIKLLDKELTARGLKPFAESPYELKVVSGTEQAAYILDDGDY